MKANSKIEKSDLVGGIQDFPIEVVEKMIEEQVKQGNLPDVEVFQKNPIAGMDDGGFNWKKTEQGYEFWDEVIGEGDFELFFMTYNKTTNTRDMDKFEYKVVTLTILYSISDSSDSRINYDIEYLNDLGAEGWEVCAVDGPKYLLKRVKQE